MKQFLFQYRREQRVTFPVLAATQKEADDIASGLLSTFDLKSKDDTSDDKGELECLQAEDIG